MFPSSDHHAARLDAHDHDAHGLDAHHLDAHVAGPHRPTWRTVPWDGEVDLVRAPAMLARTLGAVGEHGGVVVDLEQVQFMDAAGLRALIHARARLRALGRRLLVRNPPPMVRWMLDRFDLEDLVDPVPEGDLVTPAPACDGAADTLPRVRQTTVVKTTSTASRQRESERHSTERATHRHERGHLQAGLPGIDEQDLDMGHHNGAGTVDLARRSGVSAARLAAPSGIGRPSVSEPSAAEERLREIQSIMDTALQHLDVDELLTVLLDRVLVILSADTAAVLLHDESTRELVARAARGVEEEVRRGIRIPVGTGFAGRIAAERRAVILDRVDTTTVANPILWEKGIKAMLGVPLVAGDQLLGVLHVGRLTERHFGIREVELLEMVAGRVSGAVQTSMLADERTASKVLQRSLLPTALPRSPDLRLASRYLPAGRGGIGGDWYDAFSLPSGELWVMIGDVGGHGLRPAVVMGRLRSALRAYAFEGWPPGKVLHLADQKLQHFEPGVTATVACAVFSAPFDHFHLALAGHPPPVLATPGRESRLLDITPSPLFGLTTDPGPSATRIGMPPDGVLVLYTDGLIERRDEAIDQGLERLRSTVTADDPEAVCQQVTDALIDDWAPEDDVALLALQRRSPFTHA